MYITGTSQASKSFGTDHLPVKIQELQACFWKKKIRKIVSGKRINFGPGGFGTLYVTSSSHLALFIQKIHNLFTQMKSTQSWILYSWINLRAEQWTFFFHSEKTIFHFPLKAFCLRILICYLSKAFNRKVKDGNSDLKDLIFLFIHVVSLNYLD